MSPTIESLELVIQRQGEQLDFWKEHAATLKRCLELVTDERDRYQRGLQRAQAAIFNAIK